MHVPKSWNIEQFKKALEEPQESAKDTGHEQLAYLDKLQPKKKIRLTRMLNEYINREDKVVTPKNKRDSRAFWKDF